MSQTSIKKDYRSFTTFQRERFFTGLKLLSVLPPRQKENIRKYKTQYTYKGQQKFVVTPTCIHDQFISAHGNHCQHHNFQFVYYHRHLITCTVMEQRIKAAQDVKIVECDGRNKLKLLKNSSQIIIKALYFQRVEENTKKIILRLSNLSINYKDLTEQAQKVFEIDEQFANALKKGIFVSNVTYQSKGKNAQSCPNCKKYKDQWVQCREKLIQLYPQLFCNLARSILNQTVFEIQNETIIQQKHYKLNDLLRLIPAKENIFQVCKFMQGAVQVYFNVRFNSDEQQNCSIKINAYSYSVKDDSFHNIISFQKQSLNCAIQLPQIIERKRLEAHPSFVYRLIKVLIQNGSKRVQFQFPINTYHDLIRYDIDIVQKKGEQGMVYDVAVRDRDYRFKLEHYSYS